MLKKILALAVLCIVTVSCANSSNDRLASAKETGGASSDAASPASPLVSNDEHEAVEENSDVIINQTIEFFFDIQTMLYGLREVEGSILVEPIWTETAGEFREGLAWVKENKPEETIHKTGYIDKDGNYVIEPQDYEAPSLFSEGLAYVRISGLDWPGRRIYIDREGNVALGESHRLINAGMFKNGYAICDVELDNVQFRFSSNIIDKNGRVMLSEYYDFIAYSEIDNLYVALNNNATRAGNDKKAVFISKDFEVLAEFKAYSSVRIDNYHDMASTRFFNEYGMAVLQGDSSGFDTVIDKSFNIVAYGGEAVFDKNYIRMFERFYEFDEQTYIPTVHQKVAFFDYSGNMIMDFSLDHAETSDGSFYAYVSDGKWGYLSSDLNMVTKPDYDYAGTWGDGAYVVVKDGKFGFIDDKLTPLIPPQYDFAGEFINGIAPVIHNERFFFINQSGIEIQVSSEDKSDYLSLAEGKIKNLPYLFIDDIDEKIISFLQPLFARFKPPVFEEYSEIPPGRFFYNSIAYSVLPNINPKNGVYNLEYSLPEAMKSAALTYGYEMASHMKPGPEYLITYDEGTQIFRHMETATYDYTDIVVLDTSSQNNVYDITISTSLVMDMDALLLNTSGVFDFELSRKVLYYDMQDENMPLYQLYSSHDYYTHFYETIHRRGVDYIKANPEMFDRYKIILELSNGMFRIKSIRRFY